MGLPLLTVFAWCTFVSQPTHAVSVSQGGSYEVTWSGAVREGTVSPPSSQTQAAAAAALVRSHKVPSAPEALEQEDGPIPGLSFAMPKHWPHCQGSTPKECSELSGCWWVVRKQSCRQKCPGAPKWYCLLSDNCRWTDALGCVESEHACGKHNSNMTECDLDEECMGSLARGCINRAHARCSDYNHAQCQVANPKDCMTSALSHACIPVREAQCQDYNEANCAKLRGDRCIWDSSIQRCTRNAESISLADAEEVAVKK